MNTFSNIINDFILGNITFEESIFLLEKLLQDIIQEEVQENLKNL